MAQKMLDFYIAWMEGIKLQDVNVKAPTYNTFYDFPHLNHKKGFTATINQEGPLSSRLHQKSFELQL